MGLKDNEVSRLLAGGVPSDDPELGKVSDFLTSMRTALPPVSPSACEDRHLAVVTREARILAGARVQDRRSTVRGWVGARTRRALAATGAAVLVALTAGVGVAAAMGVDPLSLIPGLPIGQPESPRPATPTPEPGDRSDGAADGTEGGNPRNTPVAGPLTGSPDPVEGRPTADPTASPAPSVSTGNGKGNSGNGNGNGGDGSNGTGNDKGNSGNGNGNGGGDGSNAGGNGNGNGKGSGKATGASEDKGSGTDQGKDAAP